MGAARHGQEGALAPLRNSQMGTCYCYEVYVRVPKSSMTVLSVYLYCMYDVCDSYNCFYAVRCCN